MSPYSLRIIAFNSAFFNVSKRNQNFPKKIENFQVDFKKPFYTSLKQRRISTMTYQNIFKRYEIKFILTSANRKDLMEAMSGIMKIDKYGHTTIRNIYFDTGNFRLIRTSLDKPVYKEKLRVRSYQRVTGDDPVFVELKKKYDSVVYKRRIAMTESIASEWLEEGCPAPYDSQIAKEIGYFVNFYQDIGPKVFLSYEREAFYPEDGSDIRITLDSNIIARDYDLSLQKGVYGRNILDRDLSVLEVKVSETMPVWLIRFLRENNIVKSSFSKYGMYYMNSLKEAQKERNGGLLYA